jgi:phage shock protein PspC (stress-responsive transcriptional regulator)
MNKTISINLSGLIFHIEEEAYEILKNYLNELKKHFSSHSDGQEIVADIANRIAETFSEITKEKQFISSKDVEDIIQQIGKVEAFEETDEESHQSNTSTTSSDKRKLFRDADNSVLGGVCSGLGKYFDVDPIWIRLVWFASVVFFGFGFFLYIFFWIIIPEAKTRADKLNMEGKPYTINNLKETIEKEFDNISQKTKSGQLGRKFADFITSVVELFIKVFGGVFQIIGKVLGGFFLIIGVLIGTVIAIQLFQFFIHKDFNIAWNDAPFSLMHLQFAPTGLQNAFLVSLLCTILIPVTLMFLGGLNLLFKIKSINKPLSAVFSIAFVISLVCTLYYGSKVISGFRHESTVATETVLKEVAQKTYYIKFNNTEFTALDSSLFKSNMDIHIDDDDFHWRPIELNVYNSNSVEINYKKKLHARGKNTSEAFLNAKNIAYNIAQMDSVLYIDRIFTVPEGTLFKGQHVTINFNFPDGTTLFLDQDVADYFDNIGSLDCAYSNEETLCLYFENGQVFCKNTLEL